VRSTDHKKCAFRKRIIQDTLQFMSSFFLRRAAGKTMSENIHAALDIKESA
jgi:hypothetical protein